MYLVGRFSNSFFKQIFLASFIFPFNFFNNLKDQNFKKDFNHVLIYFSRYHESIRLIHVKVTFPFFSCIISGEGDDYLTVSLRDGGVAVGMTLAKGRLDLHIKPVRVRFDDNQWHRIIVHRKVQEVRKFVWYSRIREFSC